MQHIAPMGPSAPLVALLLLLCLGTFPPPCLGRDAPGEILAHHTDEGPNTKNLPLETLAYVTPWNSHGYDIAKRYAAKFSLVSPVWFNIRPRPRGSGGPHFEISGGHDVDQGWVQEVRQAGGSRIIPRFSAEAWQQEDYLRVISSEQGGEELAGLIHAEVQRHAFDGMVLEIQGAEKHLGPFLAALRRRLSDRVLVLVIPPLRGRGGFGREDLLKLSSDVDYFSLMTYDYSNPQRPGPNAPLDWARKSLAALADGVSPQDKRKILLGLNFYGNDYLVGGGGGPILGPTFIELLRAKRPKMKWSVTHREHFFNYEENSQEHLVYFPSLRSIEERLELAREQGVGVSIWEIGQGLDYWYSLF